MSQVQLEGPDARSNQAPFEDRAAISVGKLKLIGYTIEQVFSLLNNSVRCVINVRNKLDEELLVHWPALVHGKPSPKAGEFEKNPLGGHEEENVGCENVDNGLLGPEGFLVFEDKDQTWSHLAVVTFEVPYGQSFPTFYNCYCNVSWVSRKDGTLAAYLEDPSQDHIEDVFNKFYREYQTRTARFPGTNRRVSAHIGNSYKSVLAIHLFD